MNTLTLRFADSDGYKGQKASVKYTGFVTFEFDQNVPQGLVDHRADLLANNIGVYARDRFSPPVEGRRSLPNGVGYPWRVDYQNGGGQWESDDSAYWANQYDLWLWSHIIDVRAATQEEITEASQILETA